MVSALVIALALGLIQLAITLHVRNMILSAATEGARVAAAYDRSIGDGEARTSDVLGSALPGMSTTVTVVDSAIAGQEAVAVTVTAPIPVIGLWGGGSMSVTAHAYKEVWRDARAG